MVEARIKRFGLSMEIGRHFELVNPEDDPRYRDYVATYVEAAGRKGITPDAAKTLVRTNSTVIGALAVRRGDADALICGLEGRFQSRVKHIKDIIGLAPGVHEMAALSLVITSKGAYFLADTHVQLDPTRGGDRRHDDRLRQPRAPLRHRAQDRAAVARGFRRRRHPLGVQDARGARLHQRARAGSRGRRRDAGGCGPVRDDPRAGLSGIRA